MPVDDLVGERTDLEVSGLDALEVAVDDRRPVLRRAWSATWPKVLAICLAIGIWQLVVASGWKPRFALASPAEAFGELREMLADGTIGDATRVTMTRMSRGYALSLVIGVLVGAAVSQSRLLRSAVGSMITGLQTMPSVAWFPLAILLFRISEAAILFVVVIGAAPSIANGLIAGIDNVPPLYTRAGRVLGARGLAAWRHVKLPAAFPLFLGGMKQGWAFAWRSLMAGELLVLVPGQESLGHLLALGRDLSDSPLLLASMITVLGVGILVDAVLFGSAERWVRRRWGLAQP